MQNSFSPRLILIVIFSYVVFFFCSCKKEVNNTVNNNQTSCDIKGSYLGIFTNQFTQNGNCAFVLGENYFLKSAANLSTPPTAFGGYSNTCDSVKMNFWNSINSNYYYFAGKLSTDLKTISGTYRNLTTTSEIGTFSIIKQ